MPPTLRSRSERYGVFLFAGEERGEIDSLEGFGGEGVWKGVAAGTVSVDAQRLLSLVLFQE